MPDATMARMASSDAGPVGQSRGETLTTLNLTDTGEVTVGRQDRVAELRGLER